MRKKTKILSLLIIATMGLVALAACSKTDTMMPSDEDLGPHPLAFSVTTANSDATIGQEEFPSRGLAVTTEMSEPFGIIAYVYDQGAWDPSTATPYGALFNKEVQYFGDGKWNTVESVNSVALGKMVRLYAYSPFYDSDEPNGTVVLDSEVGDAGRPRLTITVPAAVEEQADVMYATASYRENEGDEPVEEIPSATFNTLSETGIPMTFRHLMTQIRFETGTISKGVIKRITLSGINSKATYTVGNSDIDEGSLSTPVNYTITPDFNTKGETGRDINGDNQRLMMLPQTLNGVSISMVFDDGSEHQFTSTTSLDGDVWQPGKIVTYMVSITSFKKLEVKCVSIQDWNDGGEVEAGVSDSNIIRPGASVSEWDQQETTEDTKPINE